jgi:outer membrane cobalamin receptor
MYLHSKWRRFDSPTDFQGTLVKLEAGNYGTYKVNAGHYNKVNDKLSFSISGNYQHNDGFFTNHYLNQKADDLDSYGFRNRIIYKVSSRLELENIASFENSKQGGYPYGLYHKDTKILDEVNYDQASSYDRLMFSDAFKLKLSGKNWELSNTLSYQLIDDVQKIDQDFTPDWFAQPPGNHHAPAKAPPNGAGQRPLRPGEWTRVRSATSRHAPDRYPVLDR